MRLILMILLLVGCSNEQRVEVIKSKNSSETSCDETEVAVKIITNYCKMIYNDDNLTKMSNGVYQTSSECFASDIASYELWTKWPECDGAERIDKLMQQHAYYCDDKGCGVN